MVPNSVIMHDSPIFCDESIELDDDCEIGSPIDVFTQEKLDLNEAEVLDCTHIFDRKSIQRWVCEKGNEAKCPLCKLPVRKNRRPLLAFSEKEPKTTTTTTSSSSFVSTGVLTSASTSSNSTVTSTPIVINPIGTQAQASINNNTPAPHTNDPTQFTNEEVPVRQRLEQLVQRQIERDRTGIDSAQPPRTVHDATAAIIDPEAAASRDRLNRMHERVTMKRSEVDLLTRIVGAFERITTLAEEQYKQQQEFNKQVLEHL